MLGVFVIGVYGAIVSIGGIISSSLENAIGGGVLALVCFASSAKAFVVERKLNEAQKKYFKVTGKKSLLFREGILKYKG